MRIRPLILLVVAPLAVAGCGGSAGPTPGGALSPEQQSARLKFVAANANLNDLELAHLCPALYPKDVQAAIAVDFTAKSAAGKKAKESLKKYRFESQKVRVKTFSAAQLEQAKAARCGSPIAIPQVAQPAKAK